MKQSAWFLNSLKLSKESPKPVSALHTAPTVNPSNTLCIGCSREIAKAFALVGKVWVATSVIKSTRSEMIWNPKTGETVIEEVAKITPIPSYRHGIICSDCASDYRVVERTHKDGSTSWVPRVILDKSVTEHTTIPSGQGRLRVHTLTPKEQHKAWLVEQGIKAAPVELPDYRGKR